MPVAARCISRSEPLDIKSQIERNIGCIKAERYFDLLSKFLGAKIGRSEFDVSLCCVSIALLNLCNLMRI